MTSSEIFKRETFYGTKNIVKWKIRSLWSGLESKQDVAKGVGLESKVNALKMC